MARYVKNEAEYRKVDYKIGFEQQLSLVCLGCIQSRFG
jgi:hypothetical protein